MEFDFGEPFGLWKDGVDYGKGGSLPSHTASHTSSALPLTVWWISKNIHRAWHGACEEHFCFANLMKNSSVRFWVGRYLGFSTNVFKTVHVFAVYSIKLSDFTGGVLGCSSTAAQDLCSVARWNLERCGIYYLLIWWAQMGVLWEQIRRRLIERCGAIHDVRQNTYPFYSPQQFQQWTDSTPTVYYILSSEKNEKCLHFSNNIDFLNAVVQAWNDCTIANDQSQILTRLSLLEPTLRHQDIQNRWVENVTCDFGVQHPYNSVNKARALFRFWEEGWLRFRVAGWTNNRTRNRPSPDLQHPPSNVPSS